MWRSLSTSLVLTTLLLTALVLSGCGKGSGGSADLSSPQAAVKSYVTAMKAGDAAGMKATITGGDPKVVDAIVSAQVSRKKLEDAAIAKFGEDGRTLTTGEGQAAQFDKLVDNAEVKENGDTATVTPKGGAMSGGITLRKVSGDWKIDMAAMPGADQMVGMLPMLNQMTAMNNELTGEISAGKYKSAPDAKAAQSQKMMSAITGGKGFGPPPTTQPPK